MNYDVKIGQLIVDCKHGLFVRVPWVGQLHYGPEGLVVDRWSTLRRTGEA